MAVKRNKIVALLITDFGRDGAFAVSEVDKGRLYSTVSRFRLLVRSEDDGVSRTVDAREVTALLAVRRFLVSLFACGLAQ